MHGKRSKLAQKIIHHLCTILTCVVKAGMMQDSFAWGENVKYVLWWELTEWTGVYLFHVFPDMLQPDTTGGNVEWQNDALAWL